MNLPKVKFTDIPLNLETDWIHGFLFQNEWGWGKYILKKHPKIKEIFSLKTENDQVGFLKTYIADFRGDNKELIENNRLNYQNDWKTVERDFFITLSDILQISWPENRKSIKAMISINPICPRFLDSWRFSVFYDYKKKTHLLEVIMHECCHFLYFEKWKSIFPQLDPKTNESPYIEWHLSELLAPIILNDMRIQKLLKQKAVFYEKHQAIIINGKTAPEYFTDLYNKALERNDFSKFLKEAYETIKKHESLFVK